MRIFLAILMFAFAVCAQATPANLGQAIDSLDLLIERADEIYAVQHRKISLLEGKARKAPEGQKALIYKQIGDEFRRFDVDSSIYYYGTGLRYVEGDSVLAHRLIWARSSLMPVNGRVLEAVAQFENHPPTEADQAYLTEYYNHGARLYAYMIDDSNDPQQKREYANKSMSFTQKQLLLLPQNSPLYQYTKAELYCFQGDFTLAAAQAQELLPKLSPDDHLYARTASLLADYYKTLPAKENERLYYLALAACADIRSATRESTALQRLGVELHKRGDINRSYSYLMKSLEDAVGTGSKLRILESAEYMPLISESFKAQERKNNYIMLTFLLALVGGVGVMGYLMRRLRRSGQANEQLRMRLQDDNGMKDEYIQKILTMCSLYIERMEEFNRLAGRKIKAGQVQDLYQMIESGKILQEQASQFYEIFDKAFFGIHPDFVEKVNVLLQPDKQIVLPVAGRLTPELRILAFLRLGIDDSARLSKFLGLSLNTIYTYRNKLKSRALNRDTFEESVKKIDQIV